MPLTPQDLLLLGQNRGATLADLDANHQDLAAKLRQEIAGQKRQAVFVAFEDASPEARAVLTRVDFASDHSKPAGAAIAQVIGAADVDPKIKAEISARLGNLSGVDQRDVVGADVPIERHPRLEQAVATGRLAGIAQASGLKAERVPILLKSVDRLERLDDDSLDALARSGALTKDEVRKLGVTNAVYGLSDGNAQLAAYVGSLADMTAEKLASQGTAFWETAITRSQAAPPEGLDAKGYAKLIDERLTELFPQTMLLERVMPRGREVYAKALEAAAPLYKLNDEVATRDFDELKLGQIPANQRKQLRAAHADLQAQVRLHPGLELDRVADGGSAAAKKVAEISRRLDQLQRFEELNKGVDVLSLDLSHGSADVAALKFDGIAADDQRLILNDYRAYQRVTALAGSASYVEPLLSAGYRSSRAISDEPLDRFAQKTGLELPIAASIHDKATTITGMTIAQLGSILELVRPDFSQLAVANVGSGPLDQLRELEGFAQLFGSQDFCNCQHCQSILSPAAYFVDLMRFIDQHVTSVYFTGAKADDPLSLKARRPDLWSLPLTCENTDTVIPTLDVINEVLENHLVVSKGLAIDLTDRSAVLAKVYGDILPAAFDSFRQPFILPLERTLAYLSYFSRDLQDVAEALGSANDEWARAALGLTPSQLGRLLNPTAALADLSRIYGITFTAAGAGVAAVESGDLLKYTGLDRDDLDALHDSRFVNAAGTENFRFEQAKRSADSIQNDVERVLDLTPSILDRIHRFTRLARQLPWTLGEVDILLEVLGGKIDQATMLGLARLKTLAKNLKLTAEEVAAFAGAIPQRPAAAGKASLMDRLFNAKVFANADGNLPKPGTSFIHPSFRDAPAAGGDTTLARLMAGLRVDSEQLALLITGLAGPLGANLAEGAPEAQRGFDLSVANLSLLYRHARLFQALKLKVPQLFQLIALAGLGDSVQNPDAALTLQAVHAVWRSAKLKLDEIGFITKGKVVDPSGLPDPASLADSVAGEIEGEQLTRFADTIFAFLPNVTEDQSRAIFAANAADFVKVDDNLYRLADGFDPAANLAIPAGVQADPAAARNLLLNAHSSRILPLKIAGALKIAQDRLDEILAMLGTDLSKADLVASINGGSKAPLEALLKLAAPLALLFRDSVFDAPTLAFIREHKALFAIADFTSITAEAVRKLLTLRQLLAAAPLAQFAEDPARVDPAAVVSSLSAFDPANHFAAVDMATLGAALGIERPTIAALLPHVTLPDTAPEALSALAGAARLAHDLGLNGQALRNALADNYADLSDAADSLLATFRMNYPDEADFEDRVAPSENRVRSRKRDALTDYLIMSLNPRFESRNAIYEHFLLDVNLEGCARTSRIVAGLSTLQLYCHRVLINLEQDNRDDSDPKRIHVPPSAIPEEEWSWRKNYRVWEANRKVFLFPESYIEPDLRDDKTPLFRELEEDLLQQDINEQTVLDAYTRFLAGFEEIARLKISGAYHDRNAEQRTDILHLFGVTSSDPPVHYYRTVENAFYGESESDRGTVWGPWTKISVQIPARVVSPAVYLGRLFLFWVETTTQVSNAIKNGEAQFTGYKHRQILKYTSLRLDGSWTPPQTLNPVGAQTPLAGSWVKAPNGFVSDPLFDAGESWLNFVALLTPRYDVSPHYVAQEDYTLRGYVWDRVYPEIKPGGDLVLTSFGFGTRSRIDFLENALLPIGNWNMQAPNLGAFLTIRNIAAGPSIVPTLYCGRPAQYVIDPFAQATASRLDSNRSYLADRIFPQSTIDQIFNGLASQQVAGLKFGADLIIINGAPTDAILTSGQDLIYLQAHSQARFFMKWRKYSSTVYVAKRLNTGLADELSRALFMIGVDGLLDIESQKTLRESPAPFEVIGGRIQNEVVEGAMDFTGSLGVYFREIFFHVPALIANHLNASSKYAASQRWYEFIFDPTASETIVPPPGLSEAEKVFRLRDRVWRYIEFRNQSLPKLREMLTNPVALETYKKDPFNPHAIARLRLSAYQKTIVMKYIDNLLDWGDDLFTQFTTETINEADMLYVMASDLLGPRPAKLGSCGEGAVVPKTYANIAPEIGTNEEVLVELEQWLVAPQAASEDTPAIPWPPVKRPPKWTIPDGLLDKFRSARAWPLPESRRPGVPPIDPKAGPRPDVLASVIPDDHQAMKWGLAQTTVPRTAVEVAGAKLATVSRSLMLNEQRAISAPPMVAMDKVASAAAILERPQPQLAKSEIARPADWARTSVGMWTVGKLGAAAATDFSRPGAGGFRKFIPVGKAIVDHLGPIFCVPANKDLLGYWDRVEDRLFKIRNCRDINGVSRLPSLFDPEIDPRLLVRARAEGLSLEDVLNAGGGSLPPYRFSYLIEKAKQYTATVQAFGSALYAALERRDNEELARLRLVHQQNLLKLGTKAREYDIRVADDAIEQLARQQAMLEYRLSFHQGLLDGDLNDHERKQQIARHTATAASTAAALQQMLGAVAYLIPQLGSPFAMKYGGVELGNSAQAFATFARNTATLGEQIAASEGLEASFDRRRESWEHQVKLATHELKILEKQQTAASIRREIAQRSLDIHNETIRQGEEIFEFNLERFTSLGLYTQLASSMQRLFREAYNGALATARLAEQAYRFERDDEVTQLLEPAYWDPSGAGLLAGEKLMIDLLAMERRFIETNTRGMEVDQAISLSQIDPAALLALRETGTCTFSIPEFAFDLYYPGQYRRRVKSVRLTIPSVTGPFTNVAATLTMTGSKLRRQPVLGDDQIVDVALRRSTTIATSTAQNDAGVFEFSFRDERYMPFEGSGAVSSWRLSLPANFRPFDYQTITDVLVHIAYTAEFDEAFRDEVDNANADTEGTLANLLTNVPLARTFSMRQEFSNAFSRLLNSPPGSEVQFEITARHFPLFLQGRELEIDSASMAVRTGGESASALKLALDGKNVTGFAADPALANLQSKPLGTALTGDPVKGHSLKVVASGDLGPASAGDTSALDPDKVKDILLHIRFKLA